MLDQTGRIYITRSDPKGHISRNLRADLEEWACTTNFTEDLKTSIWDQVRFQAQEWIEQGDPNSDFFREEILCRYIDIVRIANHAFLDGMQKMIS